MEQAEAYAPSQAFGKTIMIIGGLALLLASAIAFGLARTINRPILALKKGVERFGKGELGLRLPETSGDELGSLAQEFNTMASTLSEKEAQLRAYTTELETANKELEVFSYSVTHDLRASLRAIDSFSNIILEDYADKLDNEGKRLFNIVRNNTKKMAQLIEDLLAFSHIGRKEMGLSEINMEELVKAVLEELKPTTVGRTLRFEIKSLPSAQGDTTMIRQVFANLLSNAVKFTRPKETAVIEVGGTIERKENIYYVKDNGVGFDMQYVNKLFSMFQRLHSAEEFEGTGVGLAIVQRIIHRHGGRVWPEGKVNEGATFYFTLPKSAVSDQQSALSPKLKADS